MCSCDEGPIHILRKSIVDHFAFKYYGNFLNPLKLYGSKHMYEPANFSCACTIIGRSTKDVGRPKRPSLFSNGKK